MFKLGESMGEQGDGKSSSSGDQDIALSLRIQLKFLNWTKGMFNLQGGLHIMSAIGESHLVFITL